MNAYNFPFLVGLPLVYDFDRLCVQSKRVCVIEIPSLFVIYPMSERGHGITHLYRRDRMGHSVVQGRNALLDALKVDSSPDLVPFMKEMQRSLHCTLSSRPRRLFLPTVDAQITASLATGWYGIIVEGRICLYM